MSINKNKKIPECGIGARLRGLREAEGLSLRKFSERHGFTYSLWNDYENCKRKPNATTIEKLCETFGVSADWILRGGSAQALKALGDEILNGLPSRKAGMSEPEGKAALKKALISNLSPSGNRRKGTTGK